MYKVNIGYSQMCALMNLAKIEELRALNDGDPESERDVFWREIYMALDDADDDE